MKRLPIGISDYQKMIEENYSYVDKTLLIEEVLSSVAEVLLIPRPRRFGKTMNLSMLKCFFEKTKNNLSHLFTSFDIGKTRWMEHQGQYPVIFLTLKGVKKDSWEEAYEGLQSLIAEEYKRHRYLLEHLYDDEKDQFYSVIHGKLLKPTLFENSLKFLTHWLQRYYKKRVIVLIDEYDTPIHAAYVKGYYEKMIGFMRNWLGEGLKDNAKLEKAVLTGILRVSKESIFPGLL